MDNNRRSFLQKAAILTGAFSLNNLFNETHAADCDPMLNNKAMLTPEALASDEDYWSYIQQAYTVNPNIINLNNGGVSPAPITVQQALQRYNQLANEGPSYYMWRILDQGREPLRAKLAELAGCDPNEVAINRNTTEALNTVIYGLRLQNH